jgi:trigger factor
MKVTIEKLPKSQVKLTIEVEAADVQPFLDAATREESKKHPIKGFRPGSVPFDVMRSAIGDHHLIETALQKLVPKTYVDALMEHDEIEAIGRPEVATKEVEIGKNWIYEAMVAVLPDIELGEYKKLKEEKKSVSVDKKEVDAEIEALRKMRASYVTVPRGAQKGDRVDIDINVSADKVPLEDGNARKQTVIMGDSHLFPEFEAQLMDAKEGDLKEFPIKFPEDHPQQDMRNRTIDFKVKVLTVQEEILPELDEKFAQGMGKFSNIEELKNKIEENLKLEKEEKEKLRVQQALLDQVVEKTVFHEIPDVLVEGEIDKMLAEMEEGLSSMGLNLEQYQQQIKKSREELREGFKDQAIKRIKAGLTLRAIGKTENIEVPDSEVEEEVTRFLKRFPSVEEAKKRVDIEALTDITVGTLRNKKVFELLEKLAEIVNNS